MKATVKDAVGNIAALEYAGRIKGIFCIIVDSDGDIVQESCFPAELNHVINSSITIMQHDLVQHLLDTGKTRKDRDI